MNCFTIDFCPFSLPCLDAINSCQRSFLFGANVAERGFASNSLKMRPLNLSLRLDFSCTLKLSKCFSVEHHSTTEQYWRQRGRRWCPKRGRRWQRGKRHTSKLVASVGLLHQHYWRPHHPPSLKVSFRRPWARRRLQSWKCNW